MDFILIKPDTKEWEYMWNWLAVHPLNEGLEEPTVATYQSESWQYVGSYRDKNRLIHEFRHRIHPVKQERVLLAVKASDDFTEDQIMKSYKI